MIAKGLDFPNVTLVGVVSADTALHMPDFRSAERTFQLVAQVAGRTGRGEKLGRVIVQTYSPENPAIRLAALHDFVGFAAEELPMREKYGVPPFGRIVRVIARGPAEATVQAYMNDLAAAFAPRQIRRCASWVRRLRLCSRSGISIDTIFSFVARSQSRYRF